MTATELKPLDAGKLIDKTFKLFFSTIKNNLKISLVYMGTCFGILLVTGAVIGLFVYFNYGSLSEADNIDRFIPYIFFSIPVFLLIAIFIIIILVFFYGMVHDLYLNAYLEKEWKFKSSFTLVKKNFWPIFLNGFIYFLFYGLLNCCCLLFPLVSFLSAAIPSMLFENKRSDGLGRSFKLVSYSFWNVFGVKLLYYLITIVLTIGIILICLIFSAVVLGILYAAKLMNGPESDLFFVIFYAVFLIFYIPLSYMISTLECALNVLIFFNQKVKFENFGVEYLTNSLIDENTVENK